MKLRFSINQAECFRLGIDAPKSVVVVEINPQDLTQEQRDLIADRLRGIDVCSLTGTKDLPLKMVAKAPTFEALMDAIHSEERGIKTT